MYYALVDMRGSCCATTALAWGELKQIADMLISECKTLIYDICNLDNLSEEELGEEYYCEFGDYKELAECDGPTERMLESFSFVLADCTIKVGCLVEGYAALVEAFEEYAEDKMTLAQWSLISEIEETEENLCRLDDEMRSLNDNLSCDDYEFFVEKDCEDDCEDDCE